MSEVINHEIRVPRYRYDYIGGGRSGPHILDPTALMRRIWKAVDPWDTPNYKEYIKKRLRLPINDYRLRKENVTMPMEINSVVYWLPTGDYSTYHGPMYGGWSDTTYLTPSASQWNSADAIAKNKALLKVKDQKIHLGNFIGEWDQLMSTLINTSKRVTGAYSAVRKGDFAKAARALGTGKPGKGVSTRKSAASNWLELQYGWVPLYNDVYGAAAEVERTWLQLQKKPQIVSVVATHSLADADKFVPYYQLGGAVVQRQYMAKVRVKLSYIIAIQESNFLGRIGLTNPLSIAWELTPFSFVVDWFLPVGNAINALDATIGCNFVDGSCSHEIRSVLDFTRKFDVTAYPYRYVFGPSTARGRWFEYQRWKLSDFPAVSLPQWKNPVSAAHAANALALLTQAFSRR